MNRYKIFIALTLFMGSCAHAPSRAFAGFGTDPRFTTNTGSRRWRKAQEFGGPVTFNSTVSLSAPTTSFASAPLEGDGSSGTPFTLTTCSEGEIYKISGGSWACAADDAGAGVVEPLKLSSGAAAAPTYGFSDESGLGMFRSASGILSFAAGGILPLEIDSTGIFSNFDLFTENNAGAPGDLAIRSNGDQDTGLYWALDDTLGIGAGGAQSALFSATGLSVPGAVETSSITFPLVDLGQFSGASNPTDFLILGKPGDITLGIGFAPRASSQTLVSFYACDPETEATCSEDNIAQISGNNFSGFQQFDLRTIRGAGIQSKIHLRPNFQRVLGVTEGNGTTDPTPTVKIAANIASTDDLSYEGLLHVVGDSVLFGTVTVHGNMAVGAEPVTPSTFAVVGSIFATDANIGATFWALHSADPQHLDGFPGTTLEANQARLRAFSDSAVSGHRAALRIVRANAGGALGSGFRIGEIQFAGHDGTSIVGNGLFRVETTEAWTATTRGMKYTIFMSTTGGASALEHLRIADKAVNVVGDLFVEGGTGTKVLTIAEFEVFSSTPGFSYRCSNCLRPYALMVTTNGDVDSFREDGLGTGVE